MKWFHYSETQTGYRRTDFLVPAQSLEAFKEAAEEAGDWLDNAIVCEEEFDSTDTVGSSMDYGEPDPSEADEATVAYWTHPFALLKEKINLAATVASMAPADNSDLDESGRLLAEHLEKSLRALVGFCEIPQPKRARMEAEQAERNRFLADVIVVAVESGAVDYWADVRDYVHFEDSDGAVVNASFELRDREDDDDENPPPWTPVTIETIEAGIAKVKESGFQINGELLKYIITGDHGNDACDIDQPTSDVIVQAALFGEIRYG